MRDVGSVLAHKRRRLAALAGLCLLGAVLVVVLDRHHQRSGNALGPSVVGGVPAAKPFAYDADKRSAYERRAAFGLSHVLYAKSPGGVIASAQRTARWRPLVDRVAGRHRLDPAPRGASTSWRVRRGWTRPPAWEGLMADIIRSFRRFWAEAAVPARRYAADAGPSSAAGAILCSACRWRLGGTPVSRLWGAGGPS